ncbi:hypothetical protein H4R35_000201 [Dimargaris xerosporica]|nr:hypothetical protein H4R35_000201 [Dimargaris xerosporica]
MTTLPCPATATDIVGALESNAAAVTASAPADSSRGSEPTHLEWFVGVGVVLAAKALSGATPSGLLPTGASYTLLALPAQRPPTVHGCCVGHTRAAPGSRAPQFYDVVVVPTQIGQAAPARCFTLANVYRPPTGDILALVSHSEEVANLIVGHARPAPSDGTSPLHQIRFETQRLNAGPALSHRLPQRYPQFTAQLYWLWAHRTGCAVTANDVALFLCSALAHATNTAPDPAFDQWLRTSVTACAGKLFLYLSPSCV